MKSLHRFAEAVAAFLLAVIFIVFIVQIVFRYLLNFPIGWTHEISVIRWVWLVLFGTADRLKPQGDEFVRRAGEAGSHAEFFIAEGQPHGFFNRPPWLQRTTTRMDEFLTSLGYLEREGDVKAEKP